MKRILLLALIVSICKSSFAQQPIFNIQVDDKIQHFGVAYGLVQDQQGYIWFNSFTKGLVNTTVKLSNPSVMTPKTPILPRAISSFQWR